MLPTYSYHALQSFFAPSVVNDLVTELRTEIAARNLSPFQTTQANLQIDLLQDTGIGQIEIAPYEGQYIFLSLYTAFRGPDHYTGGIPGLPTPLIAGRNYLSIVAFAQHLFSRGSVVCWVVSREAAS